MNLLSATSPILYIRKAWLRYLSFLGKIYTTVYNSHLILTTRQFIHLKQYFFKIIENNRPYIIGLKIEILLP